MMANLSFSNGMQRIGMGLNRNQPKILMAAAGGLGIGATVMAMLRAEEAAELKKARRKAIEEREVRDHPILERAEIEIAALPAYIPTLGLQAGSLACLGLSGGTWDRRTKALGASYGMAKEALELYKGKVSEKLGPGKAEEFEDEIVQDEMLEEVPKSARGILVSGHGDTLLYDRMSGRWFYDDVDRIHRCENLLNQQVNLDGYSTLNDWYDLIGLDPIPLGDDMGWDVRHDLLNVKLVARKLEMEGVDEVPGLALEYDVVPLFCRY